MEENNKIEVVITQTQNLNTSIKREVITPFESSTELFIEGGITYFGIFYAIAISFLVFGAIGNFFIFRYLRKMKEVYSFDFSSKLIGVYNFINFFIAYFLAWFILTATSRSFSSDGLSLNEAMSLYIGPEFFLITSVYLLLGVILAYFAGYYGMRQSWKSFYHGLSPFIAYPNFYTSIPSSVVKSKTFLNGEEVTDPREAAKIAEDIQNFTKSMFEKQSK